MTSYVLFRVERVEEELPCGVVLFRAERVEEKLPYGVLA